ncbi:hypothetical protein T05_7993 [Trichinella murrelli]|uniref:Uncharacterized protein n=1 Tax=Trichinella murrelli TaxID=144512 RepID=A0A0V0THJ0_9BILA|nr:hypothetical protein T05_7993 [Trichinella murrelli]
MQSLICQSALNFILNKFTKAAHLTIQQTVHAIASFIYLTRNKIALDFYLRRSFFLVNILKAIQRFKSGVIFR